MNKQTVNYNLGTLDTLNEYTTMVLSKDFRNAVFTVIVANNADCTIQFYASNSEYAPTLASAASASNIYTSTQVVDLNTHNSINGSVGVVYSGTNDGIYRYEINENINSWLGVKITARSAGDVTISVALTNNN